jgi:hypothetical protein
MTVATLNVTRITPILSITSQGRLTTLLNDEPEGNSSRKVNTEGNKEPEDSADPFSGKHTPKEPKENTSKDLKSVQPPPRHPSDSSNLDTNSEPRKLPGNPP